MKFKTRLEKVKKWVLQNKIKSGAIGLVVLIVLMVLFGKGDATVYEIRTVSKGDFVQQVSVSGKVNSPDDVAMAFENSGRVERIHVAVGDTVYQGQPLVSLSLGTLYADLARAKANVALKSISSQSSDVDVDGALRTLLSSELVAVPSSNDSTLAAPVITGAYQSKEQGTYKLIVKRKSGSSQDFELRVFDLETAGPVEILDNEPTQLGTRGLYVAFPDDIEFYSNSIWYVSVPNVKSRSYVDNFNAYQNTLSAQDSVLTSGVSSVSQAELLQAKADLLSIETEIRERTLYAPFAGVVTALEAKLGGAVSISNPVVSLISNTVLEVESFVPEINISYISLGDTATVTLDAYGETHAFAAKVIAIDPAETVRDGVTTYRVRLHFVNPDERVRSGMTANIIITTDQRSGVITVPQGIVKNKDGKRSIMVLNGNKEEKREVITGLISSLGEIEILSGLIEGDKYKVETPKK